MTSKRKFSPDIAPAYNKMPLRRDLLLRNEVAVMINGYCQVPNASGKLSAMLDSSKGVLSSPYVMRGAVPIAGMTIIHNTPVIDSRNPDLSALGMAMSLEYLLQFQQLTIMSVYNKRAASSSQNLFSVVGPGAALPTVGVHCTTGLFRVTASRGVGAQVYNERSHRGVGVWNNGWGKIDWRNGRVTEWSRNQAAPITTAAQMANSDGFDPLTATSPDVPKWNSEAGWMATFLNSPILSTPTAQTRSFDGMVGAFIIPLWDWDPNDTTSAAYLWWTDYTEGLRLKLT